MAGVPAAQPWSWMRAALVIGAAAGLLVAGATGLSEAHHWSNATARYARAQQPDMQAQCKQALEASRLLEAQSCAELSDGRWSRPPDAFYCEMAVRQKTVPAECLLSDPGSFKDHLMFSFKWSRLHVDMLHAWLSIWAGVFAVYGSWRLVRSTAHLGWRRLAIVAAPACGALVFALGWAMDWGVELNAMVAAASAVCAPAVLLLGQRLVSWVLAGFNAQGAQSSAALPASASEPRAEAQQLPRSAPEAALLQLDPPAPRSSRALRTVGMVLGVGTLIVLGLVFSEGRTYETIVAALVQVAIVVPAIWALSKVLDWWNRR